MVQHGWINPESLEDLPAFCGPVRSVELLEVREIFGEGGIPQKT
jgi:hypothetical protein